MLCTGVNVYCVPTAGPSTDVHDQLQGESREGDEQGTVQADHNQIYLYIYT